MRRSAQKPQPKLRTFCRPARAAGTMKKAALCVRADCAKRQCQHRRVFNDRRLAYFIQLYRFMKDNRGEAWEAGGRTPSLPRTSWREARIAASSVRRIIRGCKITGGSSAIGGTGGPAVVPLAIGTDTGDSVRKSGVGVSRGRRGRRNVAASFPMLSHSTMSAIFTGNVADACLALEAPGGATSGT